MATQTLNLKLSHATDAEFRATARSVSDALLAFGWVRTADTGQIDWATVVRPSSASTIAGYEVFRMADPLQATAPVFLRVSYGTGGVTTSFSWWFRAGSGTNGAGTLTGQVGATLRSTSNGFSGGTPDASGNYQCLFSGDVNRFGMLVGTNASGAGLFANVERLKDGAGQDSPSGCVYQTLGVTEGGGQVVPATGLVPASEDATLLGCIAPGGGTGAKGNNVTIYPLYPFNVDMLNPVRGLAAVFASDLPGGQTIQASIYGVNQTWYKPTSTASRSIERRGGTTVVTLLRFE